MVPITQPEKSSIQDSIGPPSTRMPMTLSPVVTFVNVKEKLRNVMRCHKTPSKFAKSLTSGALRILRADPVFKRKRGLGTDNQEKDEKQSQNDKTGLGMEKTVKDKAKSKPESQSSQKKSTEKSTGQSVVRADHALTKKPVVSVLFIKQFWRSAEASTDDNGEVKIIATIDGHSLSITEGSLRRHLKLDDQDGITSIPNSEIFEQLALMGYHTDSDKLTFQKGAFSPQWRFLIHKYSHFLSAKEDCFGAV
ncbi:hypothetical protein Tco_0017272 [Tanacetum coccineum]